MDFKVKLEKIESKHNNLRTSEIIGITSIEKPQQGSQFIMFSEPINSDKDVRYVCTSTIKKIRNTKNEEGSKILNSYEIATENSIYRITYLS